MSAPLKSIEGTGDIAASWPRSAAGARAAARVLALGLGRAERPRPCTPWRRPSAAQTARILAANAEDIAEARAAGVTGALLDRLTLDDARVEAMAAGIEVVARAARSGRRRDWRPGRGRTA